MWYNGIWMRDEYMVCISIVTVVLGVLGVIFSASLYAYGLGKDKGRQLEQEEQEANMRRYHTNP